MSLRKNETLTGWTLLQHICLHFWAWLLNTIAITPKSEDKYVLKVFNPSEFHFSEVTFFQNWYFSCAAWNVFPINSLGRVSAPLGPPSSGITGLHHLVHYCYIKWDCRLTKFFDITVSIIYLIVMQWRDFFRLVSVLEIFFSLPGMRCKTRIIGFYKQIETSGAVGIYLVEWVNQKMVSKGHVF